MFAYGMISGSGEVFRTLAANDACGYTSLHEPGQRPGARIQEVFMSKLLLFLLALVAIYLVRKSLKGERRAEPVEPVSRRPQVETMSACAHCGVLVPQSEGVRSLQGFFCCAEHQALGPRDPA
jgi:uncharacterized protein